MYFVQFEVTQGKVNVTSDLRIITKQLNFVFYSAILRSSVKEIKG